MSRLSNKFMYSCKDIMSLYNVKKTKAYEIIDEGNYELYKKGYRTIQGRIPTQYIHKKRRK